MDSYEFLWILKNAENSVEKRLGDLLGDLLEDLGDLSLDSTSAWKNDLRLLEKQVKNPSRHLAEAPPEYPEMIRKPLRV